MRRGHCARPGRFASVDTCHGHPTGRARGVPVWCLRKGLNLLMQLSSAPGMASRLRRLWFATHAPIQFLDITDEVAELVRPAGLREGVANVFVRHTTAAICIQEAEPL